VDGAGLGHGGALWFPDLTAPDPYYILPMLSGASLFGMASLGDAGQQVRAPTPGIFHMHLPPPQYFPRGPFRYLFCLCSPVSLSSAWLLSATRGSSCAPLPSPVFPMGPAFGIVGRLHTATRGCDDTGRTPDTPLHTPHRFNAFSTPFSPSTPPRSF
jgi:hypothetical protein